MATSRAGLMTLNDFWSEAKLDVMRLLCGCQIQVVGDDAFPPHKNMLLVIWKPPLEHCRFTRPGSTHCVLGRAIDTEIEMGSGGITYWLQGTEPAIDDFQWELLKAFR
jgi:hypothetical protein